MKKRYLILVLIALSYISLFLGAKDITLIDIFTKDQDKLMV